MAIPANLKTIGLNCQRCGCRLLPSRQQKEKLENGEVLIIECPTATCKNKNVICLDGLTDMTEL